MVFSNLYPKKKNIYIYIYYELSSLCSYDQEVIGELGGLIVHLAKLYFVGHC